MVLSGPEMASTYVLDFREAVRVTWELEIFFRTAGHPH